MSVITTPLVLIGLLSVLYLSLLFDSFSRRLGAVTKVADRYRWFRVASAFVAVAAMSQVVRGTAALAPGEQLSSFLQQPCVSLVTFHIPLVVGVTIDLILVWYYWRWILREKI